MSVLLVDGDNLLTIGFYGAKNYFYKGTHIGGIFHFLNTLRRSFETYHLNKICVFWDGEDGYITRKKLYHQYKENRKGREKTQDEIVSYDYQRTRIKQYLEELFVRQGEYPNCETDDAIAYYAQNTPEDNIIIYSSDNDLTQLVSEKVQIYNPSHRKLYGPNDKIVFEREELNIANVKLVKMICGDKSDNISGIRNMGIKSFLSIFPELREDEYSLEYIKEKSNQLFLENKDNNRIKNLITGVTKEGVLGESFFSLNESIIDLTNPLLTDEAIEHIELLIHEDMDPEGRSYKNTMKMMIQDGIFNLLPKSDDAWIKFLNPFLRLTRKEKNKRKIKFRKHE